ncbi:replication protein A 70 kDa DNA-binding subunit C-like protein, partial [Tanacetum coccineum]
QLIPTFEPLLEQGTAVVITKFGIAENGGQYLILKHPFKLNFYRHTKCPDFQGSLYGFRFVPFADILNKEVVGGKDVDVIGNVVSCGNLDVYNNRNGKEQKRMTFDLQDLDCTLWDGFAQQLADFVNGHENNDYVIMIVQLGKVREWKVLVRNLDSRSQESNVSLNTDVIIPALLSPTEDVGSSKRRCILDPTNLGNSNVVVGNLDGSGQSLPLNTDVDVSGHQIVRHDVGGSKRKCSGAFEIISEGGECIPLPDEQTPTEDVGGSKRTCVRQLHSAGSLQAMCSWALGELTSLKHRVYTSNMSADA